LKSRERSWGEKGDENVPRARLIFLVSEFSSEEIAPEQEAISRKMLGAWAV
jgi:hypothetical protein